MRLVFDIETDGLLAKLTRIHCIVALDLESPEDNREVFQFGPNEIDAGLELLSKADELWGHNALSFDLPAIQKLYPQFNYPWQKVRDTLVISRLIWPDIKELDHRFRAKYGPRVFPGNLIGRHSLESWGYRLRERKGTFGKTTDWSEWSPEMQAYCVQDVHVTAKLIKVIEDKNYSQQAIELEHHFRYLMDKQEQSGFYFNREAAVKLYGQLAERRGELEAELQATFPPRVVTGKRPSYYTFNPPFGGSAKAPTKGELKDAITLWAKAHNKTKKLAGEYIVAGPPMTKEIPFNPGSRDEIATRLQEVYGWKPTKFTEACKPQVDESVLKELSYPPAKLLNEYLMLGKRIGQLAEGNQAWLKVEQDGIIHGRVNTNGAVTGRCTHSHPNVAQVPRVGSPYGEECRALFGPRPDGWWLVGADASGLELRCLAHFTARWDGGSYAREILEGDIHTANQHAAGLSDRNDAKTFIYALCYGAGDEKIGSIVNGDAKDGAALKAKFFAAMPALLRLTDAVKASAGYVRCVTPRGVFWKKPENESRFKGYILGLDKRRLPIRSAHAALNTLLQSAGALVMKQGKVILSKYLDESGLIYNDDYMFHADIHDEWQIGGRTREIAEQVGKFAVAAIRASGEHFEFRCPLDGEYKIGKNWKETH